MKRYNYRTRDLREQDNKIVKFKEELDVLITSEGFINDFRGYIEDIARYKTVKGRKYMRSTEYAAIGIMTINDLYQEAYLAFFEAYNNLDWNKIGNVDEEERGAVIWGFLKKSTILNLDKSIRQKKDGIRIPERVMFENENPNFRLLTSLFARMEVAFTNNIEEVAMTRYETDLVGAFLEVHMDEFLDLKKGGERNYKGIERELLKRVYGIDGIKISLKRWLNDTI